METYSMVTNLGIGDLPEDAYLCHTRGRETYFGGFNKSYVARNKYTTGQ